jgi:hypothetical protein
VTDQCLLADLWRHVLGSIAAATNPDGALSARSLPATLSSAKREKRSTRRLMLRETEPLLTPGVTTPATHSVC